MINKIEEIKEKIDNIIKFTSINSPDYEDLIIIRQLCEDLINRID